MDIDALPRQVRWEGPHYIADAADPARAFRDRTQAVVLSGNHLRQNLEEKAI